MSRKVELSTLDEIVKQHINKSGMKENIQFDGAQVEFTVRIYLSIPECSAFVDNAVENCFNVDEFLPEYVELFKKIQFYLIFTDLTVPSVKQNGKEILDIQRMADYIQALDLIPTLTKKYPEIKALYESLCRCVDKQIDFRIQRVVSQERYLLSQTSAQMDSLSAQMNEVFANLDGQDLLSVMKVVSSLDKGVLVDALKKHTS